MSETKISIASRPADVPLLVSFPQGVPVNAADMKFVVGKKEVGNKTKATQHMVQANMPGIKYSGSDVGEHNSKRNCHKLAVAVYNSKTNEFKLYPTNHTYILRPQAQNAAVTAPRSSLSNAARRETLTQEFGSKKKKRAMQAAKSNTISAENISGATELGNNLFADPSEAEANSDLIEAAEQVIAKSKKRTRW